VVENNSVKRLRLGPSESVNGNNTSSGNGWGEGEKGRESTKHWNLVRIEKGETKRSKYILDQVSGRKRENIKQRKETW